MRQYPLNEHQWYLMTELVEDVKHGEMPRRELLRRALFATGGIASAAALLQTVGCTSTSPGGASVATPAPTSGSQAAAVATSVPTAVPTPRVGPDATVVPEDPAIEGKRVEVPGKAGKVFAYMAKPKAPGTYPGVVIIHENMGLVPHFEEVTRRIAKLGYVAITPDLLSRAGGTEAQGGDAAKISAALFNAKPEELTDDLSSSVEFLKTQGARRDRFGAFGFCFGGGYAYRLACTNGDIAAATPFYGAAPPADLVPGLKGTIWAVYAGNDPRINGTIPDLEAAMKAGNKKFSYKIFPNVAHGFHRSTDIPEHMAAAKEAWQMMVEFFGKELKA